MTVQITIVGLGQIGASMGLALSGKVDSLHRVGYDRDIKITRQAEKLGALDRAEGNLSKAVREADLVLLTLPMDQIRGAIELIASDLKENAVVMDTGPLKEVVAAWANELLPENRHYVGLTPTINPAYLYITDSGIEAAHADLFQKSIMAIVTSSRTHSEAVKLATDLTKLLGAVPLFADAAEVDSLIAATHLMPQLMAAALLNATVGQPGWREGRKLAGRAYAEVTAPIVQLGESQSLKTSILLSRENMLRVLDNLAAALAALRDCLEKQDNATLERQLELARKNREQWWEERLDGQWIGDGVPTLDVPETPGFLSRMFGLGRKPKPKN